MVRPKKMNKETMLTEDDLPPDVIRAVEQGRKVLAIKLLQEETGLGLANAKVLVDKAARTRGPKTAMPGPVAEENNVTTLLKALLLAVLAFAFYRYYFGA